MLDNVVEIANLPVKEQDDELKLKRRHGMGFTGLGSTLALLGIVYGSKESENFLRKIMSIIALSGINEGINLAISKGCAPIFNSKEHRDAYVNTPWFKHLMNVLEITKSQESYIKENIALYGLRFTHHSSIAPTGTISLAFGDNCSSGIEPTFAHTYIRNVIVPGSNTKKSEEVESFEYKYFTGDKKNLPESFITADQIHYKTHLKMQAIAQEYVDSSISKTINMPTEISFEDFKQVYMDAYTMGCKGVTTFRYNPEQFSGVLVKKEDLQKTKYTFVTEDGIKYTISGDTILKYNGEEVMAAVLYDALKEGYYGRDK
jgi:ribonucleoside-diphosphate reductase alpha chain